MSKYLGHGDKAIIRQIVDRCHVSKSNDEVLAYLKSRLQAEPDKPVWRAITVVALARHRQNIKLYQSVLSGRL